MLKLCQPMLFSCDQTSTCKIPLKLVSQLEKNNVFFMILVPHAPPPKHTLEAPESVRMVTQGKITHLFFICDLYAGLELHLD